jgi:hypothetical protein
MNNDNGVVDSNQDQTNIPGGDSTTPQPYSEPQAPPRNNPSTQYQENTTDVNQNNQTPNDSVPSADQVNDNELLEIKRSALQNLLPIVGQLDQSPEERFQTLLMVIQASDNRGLMKEAYETASAIPDENKRAQALLAIINEVNFFTQPTQN